MWIALLAAMTVAEPQAVVPPTPHPRQRTWHEMEFNAFVHFGPNTFTGVEWGKGSESPQVFNPTAFDAKQWVRTFKEAGMKGVIITAKHHDGFCLWPSKQSKHTVAQSPWKGGTGDVLRELSEACREYGLKMGVYLSPWDRNHPAYGTPGYNRVFVKMLEEVLGNYGPIFEVWFDGANGEGPNGKKQVYDWSLYVSTVRRLQPNAVIFSDVGPDVRWVGNEIGVAGETNWGMIDAWGYEPGPKAPPLQVLNEGLREGTHWLPAESDVSIRPGWFHRDSENDKVKSPEELVRLWEASVGRNSLLLLNVPPTKEGKIHSADIASLRGMRNLLDATYGTPQFHTSKVDVGAAIVLPEATAFDRVVLTEPYETGQKVAAFTVQARVAGVWEEIARGTTIGRKRILPVTPCSADALRINVSDSRGVPTISSLGLYATPATKTAGAETASERAKRMAWFREARFGMFIHWGLYAIPAGKWGDKTSYGEWIRDSAQIPLDTYDRLANQFNPTKFDADAWVRMAKDAGMQYMVITTKHHDGFALFDSALSDFDMMATPFRRDIMRELADACRRHGMKLGWYHSIMDWRHPDYLPRRGWEETVRSAAGADFKRYVQYLHGQVKELLSSYGPIAVMWFDGEWESTWNDELGRDLYELCRTLQPGIIVNNRVGVSRGGSMEDAGGSSMLGDFGTPEQHIPATGLPGVDWETCMTMNDHWGWNAASKDWKSTPTLIQNLVDIASKGGNYLLNVGPMATGEFPQEAVSRLSEIGSWMKANGESIYGTSASPFEALPWGRATAKGRDIYLHVFEWPTDGWLRVPGVGNDPAVRALADGKSVRFRREESDLLLDLRSLRPDPSATVLKLTFDPAPIIYRTPTIVADGEEFVGRHAVSFQVASSGLVLRYTRNGTDPTTASPEALRTITLTDTATIKVAGFHEGKRVTEIVSRTFTRVAPRQPAVVSTVAPGLLEETFKGDWDKMPNFNSLPVHGSRIASTLAVPMEGDKALENVGLRYTGFISVPADGMYRLTLTSDDGSRLYIGGRLVVDNDGLHGPVAKTGRIALSAGLHPIRIEWFNKTGGSVLSLDWGPVGQKSVKVTPQELLHFSSS